MYPSTLAVCVPPSEHAFKLLSTEPTHPIYSGASDKRPKSPKSSVSGVKQHGHPLKWRATNTEKKGSS